MKRFRIALFLGLALTAAAPAAAQAPRQDIIWARSTNGAPITLDGVLNEPAWAAAEVKTMRYRVNAGDPGSGWKDEGGVTATDSMYAEIRLLVNGNQMYMGLWVRDSSVGGGGDFNRFDGVLMSLKNHTGAGNPAPPAEYLYSWWRQTQPPGTIPPKGQEPVFGGQWATPPWGSPRTQAQIDAVDAVTVVQGFSNSDTLADVGYTMEMRFDLAVMGYDVTDFDGDIMEWNISIYDTDWRWPNSPRLSSNRTWWQCPWGNSAQYSQVQVHARPDVNITSGPVPVIGPGLIIPNAGAYPAPVIDGILDEPMWALAPSVDIRYGDQGLWNSYPGVGKWRAGQFQPEVNGGQAAILDPANATVKYFFKEDSLYLGFDVNDQVVQYVQAFDRWDGFIVSINDRVSQTGDHTLTPRRLTFQVAQDGTALAQDYLPFLRDSLNGAKLALTLKAGTTVDTLGESADVGYTAELCIDLTKIGYPAGRGDGYVFLGIDHLDGDSFTPFTFSYGTRTWWYREFDGSCCPIVAYTEPTNYLVGIDDVLDRRGGEYLSLGNAPNPFSRATSIRFALTEASRVGLEVFDLSGRRVASDDLGVRQPGTQSASFIGRGLKPGLYLYRLRVSDISGTALRTTLSGKMMLVE
jgi:hypothetical protein